MFMLYLREADRPGTSHMRIIPSANLHFKYNHILNDYNWCKKITTSLSADEWLERIWIMMMWSDWVGCTLVLIALNIHVYSSSMLTRNNRQLKQHGVEEKSYIFPSKQKPQKLNVYLISNDFSVELLNYLRWGKKIVRKERRVLNCNYNIINPSIISVNIYCDFVCCLSVQPAIAMIPNFGLCFGMLGWWRWYVMIGRSGVLSQCQKNVKPRLVRKDGRWRSDRENGFKMQHFFRYWRMNSHLIISVQFSSFCEIPCRCVR